MKSSSLILAAILVFGSALSSTALAHGNGSRGHGHGHGWSGYAQHDVRRHHRPRGHHYDHRAQWRRDHRDYRPHYRRGGNDNWYGLHLFLGGR